MEIFEFLSTHWYLVVVIVVLALCCCCCLCCCCYKNTSTSGKTTRRRRDSPGYLEAGSFELTNTPSKGIKSPTTTNYTSVECDGPEDYPDILAPAFNVNRERPVTRLPHQFQDFVIQKIVPYFNNQRERYQFAVVMLLSESDFNNINQIRFNPSDFWGHPILNRNFSLMPQNSENYGNYIVARPSSSSCHTEEEIFGQYSVVGSPFSRLWSAYVKRNNVSPKFILIYSWILPCSRCTDVIIRSLGEEPYNCTNVIVAHTICWLSETNLNHKNNKEKLMNKNITVEQVDYPIRLQLPA